MQWTSRKKFAVGHIVLLGIFSVFFWRYLEEVLMFPEIISLIMIALSISGIFVWILLGFILWQEWQMKVGGIFVLVAPLVFQEWDVWVLLVSSVAGGLFFLAARLVQREAEDRLRFSPPRILAVAKSISICAFSLLLSSVYFTSIQTVSWEDIVPRFRFGNESIQTLLRWGGIVQPEMAVLGEENWTVDAYLRSISQVELLKTDVPNQVSEFPRQFDSLPIQGMSAEFSRDTSISAQSVAEEYTMMTGRKQLSELAGRPVDGEERLSDLFAEILQNKLFAIFEGSRVREHVSDRMLPVLMATLFFLTVWPIGILLFSLWSGTTALLITIFRSARWIIVTEQPGIQERIAE